MNIYLLISSILIFLLAIIHSFLGELKIFLPMKNIEDLPRIFRNHQLFTKRTLRLVWHVTTVLGFALGGILIHLSTLPFLGETEVLIVQIIDVSMFVSFIVSLIGARGRHPSWIVFLIIGVLCIVAVM